MSKDKGTAVSTIDVGSFAIMQLDPSELVSVIRENLGGQSIKPQDFDTVKVPSGGATSWTIQTLSGEEEVKELTGVIIHKAIQRARWPQGFTGEGTPPVCSSKDSIIGIGDPGGECGSCPHAQFGSRGAGQSCSQFQPIFLLQAGDVIPKVVRVSAASLGNMKKYFLRLASASKPCHRVVTSLSLVKEKNSTGILYSEVMPKLVGELDDAQASVVKKYIEMLGPVLDQVHADRPMRAEQPAF